MLTGSVISKLIILDDHQEEAAKIFVDTLLYTGDPLVYIPYYPEYLAMMESAMAKKRKKEEPGEADAGGPQKKKRKTE